MRGILVSQVVGDQPSGFAALAFEYTAKEASRGFFVTMARYEHIHDLAVLVHGTPQIVPFPLDGHKDFVAMSGIAQAPLPFFYFTRRGRSKLPTPFSNGFVSTMMPRSARSSFTSRKLRQNHW